MRKLIGALVVGLALVALAGCGGTDAPTPTAERPAEPVVLQLRMVAMSPAQVPSSLTPSPELSDPTLADDDVPDEWVARFQSFICPEGDADVQPPPDEYALVCDTGGQRYLLRPAAWSGVVEDAVAEVPDRMVAWVVTIDFDEEGTEVLADLSREHSGTDQQCALVLDGRVLSAPTFNAVITDGRAQISGNFTEKAANKLADKLAGR